MSQPQRKLNSLTNHTDGLDIKINKNIDDISTDTLMLAKEGVAEIVQELSSEIIHRSEDTPQKLKKGKSNQGKQQEDLQILLTVSKEHLDEITKELETIDTIASPKYDTLFNRNSFNWIPSLTQAIWVKLIASILPPIIFGIVILLFVNKAENINGWTVLGVLIASTLSLIVGIWLLRVFSEAQKYNTQEKFKKRHKAE